MNSVLVIDDDNEVNALITAALTHAGFTVYSETNPLFALKTILSKQIPVVVADVMMPEMDGLTLLTKIKENTPETLFIFITANHSVDSALFALREGAFAYIRKPFDPSELAEIVKKAFESIRSGEKKPTLYLPQNESPLRSPDIK